MLAHHSLFRPGVFFLMLYFLWVTVCFLTMVSQQNIFTKHKLFEGESIIHYFIICFFVYCSLSLITNILSPFHFRFGIYPITAFPLHPPKSSKARTVTSSSESERESTKSADAVSWEPEVRAAWSVWAHIGPLVPADPTTITVFIRLEDHINRQVVKQNCWGYRKFLSQSGIKKSLDAP